jgi:hypothetical protein
LIFAHRGLLVLRVQDLDGIGEEKGEPLYMPEVPTNSTDSFAASHSTVPEAVATAI